LLEEVLMVSAADNGIVNTPSNHSVDETIERLKGILRAKKSQYLRWSTIAVRRKKPE
jgi:hypothetical protein